MNLAQRRSRLSVCLSNQFEALLAPRGGRVLDQPRRAGAPAAGRPGSCGRDLRGSRADHSSISSRAAIKRPTLRSTLATLPEVFAGRTAQAGDVELGVVGFKDADVRIAEPSPIDIAERQPGPIAVRCAVRSLTRCADRPGSEGHAPAAAGQ